MTYVCIYWFEVTWNHFKMINTKLEYSSKNQRWLPWYLLFNLCLIFHHHLITDWSFHSCIVLAKASYNRISCMCLPHSCWVAIVQHGGHCEWCKKWDHWKWMDVAKKTYIYLTQVFICLFELISNQSGVIILWNTWIFL